MRKLNRLTMTLALLIMAVGGAWADGTVYNTTVALKDLKAGDVLTDGFKLTTEKGQYIYVKGYKKDGGTAETSDYTQLNADNSTFPGGVTISESGSTYTPYADGKDANAWIVSDWKDLGSATMLYLDGYNYTPTEWSLTPDETGKKWTLDKMPASDVELQVEYFAESNLFLSKDALADAANIDVTAGDLGVQFGDDGKSANTVTEGSAMTVTYNGTKKLLGFKAVKKAPAPSLTLTSPEVGQVIGSDGKNYAYGSLPTGVTAVAKICYVSGSHGLALALTDEGQMNWSTAQTTCAAHTPAFTGGTWKLASKDEWSNMISAAGSDTDLRDGFSSVGGTNMQSGVYWSSTERDSGDSQAWVYFFNFIHNWGFGDKAIDNHVRACLEF